MEIPTREELEEVLSKCIRPLLAVDGGDIKLESIKDDGTVFVCLTGRCAGCPGSEYTLASLVEPCLKKSFKHIKKVLTVPWHLRTRD